MTFEEFKKTGEYKEMESLLDFHQKGIELHGSGIVNVLRVLESTCPAPDGYMYTVDQNGLRLCAEEDTDGVCINLCGGGDEEDEPVIH